MTSDFASMSDADLLRAAIAEEREHWDEHSDFALGQLYAGTVAGNDDLEAIWQQETAPVQAELDLHLTGGNVTGHVTNARQLALFVENVNKASKQIVKQETGKLGRDLLIEGVSPGSVRVVLLADPGTPNEGTLAIENSRFTSSRDSEALRQVARLLTNASDDADPAIAGDVRALPQRARTALKQAMKAAKTGAWEIDGSIRQRGLGADPVRLTPRGAVVLSIELEDHDYESKTEWIDGTIDGYRRSLGSFYFTPAGGGRAFAVSATPEILARAAELASDPEARVRAQIETVWTAESQSDRVTTSRALLDIRPSESGEQGSIFDAFADEDPQ